MLLYDAADILTWPVLLLLLLLPPGDRQTHTYGARQQTDLLPVCRELGIGVLAYSPLGRGLLTGEEEARRVPVLVGLGCCCDSLSRSYWLAFGFVHDRCGGGHCNPHRRCPL